MTTQPLYSEGFTFFVTGLAVPKGNHRAVVNKFTGHAILSDTGGKNLKNWEARIADNACLLFNSVSLAPWEVRLDFIMARPTSTPKRQRRPWHAKQPDIDKLIRAVLDGLTNGQVWKSDGQVARITATKVVAAIGEQAGVRITLIELGVEALENAY